MADRPLLDLIDSFQRATQLTDSMLSRRAGCYSKQVVRLREGRILRPHIEERFRTYIAAQIVRFHREFPQ